MDNRIKSLLNDLTLSVSSRLGIELSEVTIIEGTQVGCVDTYLIRISIDDRKNNVLVYQEDVDLLLTGQSCARLEEKLRVVLGLIEIS